MYSPSSLCCVELHSKSHKAYGENEVGSQHLRTLLVTLLRKDKNPVKGSITLSHTVNGEETQEYCPNMALDLENGCKFGCGYRYQKLFQFLLLAYQITTNLVARNSTHIVSYGSIGQMSCTPQLHPLLRISQETSRLSSRLQSQLKLWFSSELIQVLNRIDVGEAEWRPPLPPAGLCPPWPAGQHLQLLSSMTLRFSL